MSTMISVGSAGISLTLNPDFGSNNIATTGTWAAGATTLSSTLSVGGAVTLNHASLLFAKGVVSPVLTHNIQTDDSACTDLTVTSQAPWASATGTNRNPGNIVLAVPAKASGGAAGKLSIKVEGSEVASIGATAAAFGALNMSTTGTLSAGAATVTSLNAGSGSITTTGALVPGAITIAAGTAAPAVTQTQAVGSSAGATLTLTAQAAGTTGATDTLGGSLILASGADNGVTADGTHYHAPVIFKEGTQEMARVRRDGSGQNWMEFGAAGGITGTGSLIMRTTGNNTYFDAVGASGVHTFRAGAGFTTQLLVGTTGIGFFGVAQAARASAITQTYSTAARTVANDTAIDLVTTSATQTTPWGFGSQAQAEAIATQFNALRADVLALKKVVNAVIDDLQAYGLEQ